MLFSCQLLILRLSYVLPVNVYLFFPQTARFPYTGVDKFLSRSSIFWVRNPAILLTGPIGHANNRCSKLKCTSDRAITRNIVFLYINKTCSFHFKCISIKSFCNEAFVASGTHLGFSEGKGANFRKGENEYKTKNNIS